MIIRFLEARARFLDDDSSDMIINAVHFAVTEARYMLELCGSGVAMLGVMSVGSN